MGDTIHFSTSKDILSYRQTRSIDVAMFRMATNYAKYAKSVSFKVPEKGASAVRLTAIYKGNLCDDEKVTVILNEKGQTYTFPEKTEYMAAQPCGSWNQSRPIHTIEGTIYNEKGQGTNFEVKPMEYCHNVANNLAFGLNK